MPMTPKQELTVRDFVSEVLADESLFPGDMTVMRRSATGCCLELLGYVVTDGKFVSKDKLKPTKYGTSQVLECQWEADTAACMEAANETDSGTSTDEANSGESSKDSEVREAVLSEDV